MRINCFVKDEKLLDYLAIGSSMWSQLPIEICLKVWIVVQHVLECATIMSEFLLCHLRKKSILHSHVVWDGFTSATCGLVFDKYTLKHEYMTQITKG